MCLSGVESRGGSLQQHAETHAPLESRSLSNKLGAASQDVATAKAEAAIAKEEAAKVKAEIATARAEAATLRCSSLALDRKYTYDKCLWQGAGKDAIGKAFCRWQSRLVTPKLPLVPF